MSKTLAQLDLQRGQLVERIAHQRRELARQLSPVRATLNRADRAVAVARQSVQFFKQHPLSLGLAASALALLRPQRIVRWGAQTVAIWRTLRTVRAWVPKSLIDRILRRYG